MTRKRDRRGPAANRAAHPSRARAPEAAEAASTEQQSQSRSRTRLWAFRAILLAAPFLLLGLVEVVLRLVGFGHDLEPLFIASPQNPAYLQANPRAVTRLFVDEHQAPSVSIETAYFRATKAPGTFRVFVQGESSAAGFPYGLGASLAGVLDQRFERSFPDREIEVISTAMAAVNSYALLDFADDIIAQQPDAVVIYVGHNEFLGVLGVGSTLRMAGSPRLTRAYLALRSWRLFQAVARLLTVMKPAPSGATVGAADTLMARVAGERSIPYGSALYRTGEDQFRTNLDALLEKYRRAHVPAFIGTLVSNERDQFPLAVLGGSTDDPAGAAKMAYHTAQDAEGVEKYDIAREGYAWARDLDPLRFRAPAVFSAIIGASAKAHGAVLVNVHDRFVDASPHGLVGHGLLLEHVHPNLDGYCLLADAFFQTMTERGLPGAPVVRVSYEQSCREMPVSDIDRWLGEYKVRRIRSAWPFTTQSVRPELPAPQSDGERLAQELYAQRTSWPEAQDQLRRYYQSNGDTANYAKVSAILADAFPFAPEVQFQTAAALIAVQRPADAWRYAQRALALEPRNVNNLLVGAHALLLTQRREQGRALLEQVLALDPENATARRVLEETRTP